MTTATLPARAVHRHPSPHRGPHRRARVRDAEPAALAPRRRVAVDGDHAAGDAHAAVHVRVRRRDRPERQYVDYVVPGIILLCAGFGAASTAVYVARDMQTGIIDRFRTMPLRSGAVLTGHVVASLRAQPAGDRHRHRGRAAGRLPPHGGLRRVDRRRSGSSRSTSWRSRICSPRSASRRAAPRRRAGTGSSSCSSPTSRARSCRSSHDAVLAAVDRREPARHADHRDDPRAAVRARRSALSRGGRSAGASASCGRRRLGRVAVPAQGRASLSARSASGQLLERALDRVLGGCGGAADRVGGVRRRIRQASTAGQVPSASVLVVEERDRASRRPRRAARTTGCSSGAGLLRAPRRAAPRAAPSGASTPSAG